MDTDGEGPGGGIETIPDEGLLELRRLVLRWAARWGMAPDDAEDVAQEVLWRVARSCGRFRGESRLSSWTYRIAHNVLATRARRSELRERAEGRFSAGVPGQAGDPADGILGALEARSLIRHWLRTGVLTRPELSLIAMTAVEKRTSCEVGASLGCRPGTVRSRISRALARVRGEVDAA